MARHAMKDWKLPEQGLNWAHANVAVLMDIRDQLQSLNHKLNCFHVRRALDTIERIDKRLGKKFGPLKPRRK